MLLLYSGGLDTSVMLKWIQDEYEAEVVALTVNLGQPGEDFDVVQGQGAPAGRARLPRGRRARGVRRASTCCRRSRPTRLYGGGYPLFTALGRPLIAKLAVEKAREAGCDTIAHGCTGKGNDQVRIESTVIALDPEMKIIAPVRGWQMGREEEIAYAREHGIPVKGGTEAPPYSIDDNLWGRSSEGGPIEDLDEPPRDDVFELVTRPEDAPDEPQDVVVGFERGVPGRARRRAARPGRAARAGRRDRLHATASGSSTTSRTGSSGLKVRDLYEVPAAAIILHRPQGAREARRHDPPEQLQAPARRPVGLPRLRGALVRAAARRPERLHGLGQRAGDGRDHDAPLQGQRAAGGARARPTRSTTRRWPASASRAGCSRSRRARASSSSGPCSRGWRTTSATGKGGDMKIRGYTVLGWLSGRASSCVAKRKLAPEPGQARRRGRPCWRCSAAGIAAARAPQRRRQLAPSAADRPAAGRSARRDRGSPAPTSGACSEGRACASRPLRSRRRERRRPRGVSSSEARADRDQQVKDAERDEEGRGSGLVRESGDEAAARSARRRARSRAPHAPPADALTRLVGPSVAAARNSTATPARSRPRPPRWNRS